MDSTNERFLEMVDRHSKLPEAYEGHGAVPNPFLRGALFGLVKKGRAAFLDAKEIVSEKNATILYSGRELNQADLDVWICLKKLWVKNGCQATKVTTNDVLKALGRSYGLTDKRWLKGKVSNLSKATLEFELSQADTDLRVYFTGRLLDKVVWVEEGNRCSEFSFELDQKVKRFFYADNYTYLDLKTRRELKTDLAKWLFSYYRSHKKIYPTYAKTLQEMCGSKSTIKTFKETLRQALNELVRIGFIADYQIDRKGIVTVNTYKDIKSLVTNLVAQKSFPED